MPARGRHRSRTSVHRRGRQSGQRRWPLVLRWLIVITVLVGPGCGRTPPANPPATPSEAPARTAQIVQRQHLSDRTWDLMIDSPAVGGRVPVRLLLPPRFEERPEQQWPVLYLLHGCCDTYVSWTRSTDIERLSAQLDALVVRPTAGRSGSTPTGSTGRVGKPSIPASCRSCWPANTEPMVGRRSPECRSVAWEHLVMLPDTLASTPWPPRSAVSSTPACPPTSLGATSALFSPTTPIPSGCGATPTSNLTSGSATTRTTSPRSWAGPGCTSPPATASLVRST